ncbi:MAG: hypothetical protein D6772_03160 [Bacteroidetes bacterium]|nr:MAG: hypothetical protein D6772_03160 [Bacteroidota bacterium]
MYNFLNKHGQLAAFLLGVVLVIIFLAIAIPGASGVNFDQMDDAEIYTGANMFNFGITVAAALTILCAAGMLIFGLVQVISNPKGSLKGIIGVAAIVLLFFIFQGMSADTPDHPTIAKAIEKYESSSEGRQITGDNLKFIGAAIRMGVLMIGAAFLALIIMPILSPILNRVK